MFHGVLIYIGNSSFPDNLINDTWSNSTITTAINPIIICTINGVSKNPGTNIASITIILSIDPCLFDFKLRYCFSPQFGHFADPSRFVNVLTLSLNVHSV